MAMGAPWGLNRSVSIGIVSCTGRYLPDHSEYSLWLQTDASVSPGTSGGPLIDTEGRVIGITTLGALVGGDMGFAIPSNTVRLLLPRLREHGEVNWSWAGVQLQPLRDFKRDIYFQWSEGVMVAGTDEESPARRAGLQPRDRIVAINGQPANALTEENLPNVRRLIGLLPKEKPAKFELMRDGKTIVVEITPREKGKVEGEELDCPRWDLTVKEINQFDNPQLYFYRKKGVFIYGVERPGNAADAGLRERDIIMQIDGREVRSLKDVKNMHEKAVDEIDQRHRMVFTVMRNGLVNQVVLHYLRDYEKE
jgi:S1-C subfamily serine protease